MSALPWTWIVFGGFFAIALTIPQPAIWHHAKVVAQTSEQYPELNDLGIEKTDPEAYSRLLESRFGMTNMILVGIVIAIGYFFGVGYLRIRSKTKHWQGT